MHTIFLIIPLLFLLALVSTAHVAGRGFESFNPYTLLSEEGQSKEELTLPEAPEYNEAEGVLFNLPGELLEEFASNLELKDWFKLKETSTNTHYRMRLTVSRVPEYLEYHYLKLRSFMREINIRQKVEPDSGRDVNEEDKSVLSHSEYLKMVNLGMDFQQVLRLTGIIYRRKKELLSVRMLKMLASFNLLDWLWEKYPDIEELDTFSDVTFARHILRCPLVSDGLLAKYFFMTPKVFAKWNSEPKKVLRIYMHLRSTFKPTMDRFLSYRMNDMVKYFTLSDFDAATYDSDLIQIFDTVIRFSKDPSYNYWAQGCKGGSLSGNDQFDTIFDPHDLHKEMDSSELGGLANQEFALLSLISNSGITNMDNLAGWRDLAATEKRFFALLYMYRTNWETYFDENHDLRMLFVLLSEDGREKFFYPFADLSKKNGTLAVTGKAKSVFTSNVLDSAMRNGLLDTVIIPALQMMRTKNWLVEVGNIDDYYANLRHYFAAAFLHQYTRSVANGKMIKMLQRGVKPLINLPIVTIDFERFMNVIFGSDEVVNVHEWILSQLSCRESRLNYLSLLPPKGDTLNYWPQFNFNYRSLVSNFLDYSVAENDDVDEEQFPKLIKVYLSAGLDSSITEKMEKYVILRESEFDPVIDSLVRHNMASILTSMMGHRKRWFFWISSRVYLSCNSALVKEMNNIYPALPNSDLMSYASARVAHAVSLGAVKNHLSKTCRNQGSVVNSFVNGIEDNEKLPAFMINNTDYNSFMKYMGHASIIASMIKTDSRPGVVHQKFLAKYGLNSEALAHYALLMYSIEDSESGGKYMLDYTWFKATDKSKFKFDFYTLMPFFGVIVKRDDLDFCLELEKKSDMPLQDFVAKSLSSMIVFNSTRILNHFKATIQKQLPIRLLKERMDEARSFGRDEIVEFFSGIIKTKQKNKRRK